ncbi:hypothetical protein [Streptomyces sp. NPDC046870]|uniref:hypothetical protein n=1 Tax=Streptomyces sp. NPDC046870 TaxID=3155135 RepID=UPI003455BC8F
MEVVLALPLALVMATFTARHRTTLRLLGLLKEAHYDTSSARSAPSTGFQTRHAAKPPRRPSIADVTRAEIVHGDTVGRKQNFLSAAVNRIAGMGTPDQ